jgi:hypothetical protein
MTSGLIHALTGLVATAGTFLILALALSGWVRSRGRKAPAAIESGAMQERVAQLETELGALAVEIERLGEHQRYVTRLLEERSAAKAKSMH